MIEENKAYPFVLAKKHCDNRCKEFLKTLEPENFILNQVNNDDKIRRRADRGRNWEGGRVPPPAFYALAQAIYLNRAEVQNIVHLG